jgi:hypothetical protein
MIVGHFLQEIPVSQGDGVPVLCAVARGAGARVPGARIGRVLYGIWTFTGYERGTHSSTLSNTRNFNSLLRGCDGYRRPAEKTAIPVYSRLEQYGGG